MRHLIAAAAVCCAVFISGAAAAQTTVTVEWLGEQSPTAGSQHTYSLNYTISGGGVDSVAFSVALPPDFAVLGVSLPQNNGVPTFDAGSGCTKTSSGTGPPAMDPWQFECLFTATSITPSAGSISGTISLVLRSRQYAFADNEVVNLSANFTSDQASASDTHPLTVQADANLTIWTSDIHAYWSVSAGAWDPDGVSGALPEMNGNFYRFPVRHANTGTAPHEPGSVAEVPLGENTWLVNYELASGWSHVAGSTAVPGQKAGTLFLSYDLVLGTSGALTNLNTYSLWQHSSRSWVTVFIACEHLGDQLNLDSDPDDAPFSYTVDATEDKVPLGAGPEDTLLTASTTIPLNGLTTGYFFNSCGSPGNSGKSSSPDINAPIGENMTWILSVQAPLGDDPWDRALVVDPIPAEVDFVNASIVTSTAFDLSTSFDLFLCNLPALAQQSFDLAAYDAHLVSGDCRSYAEFFNASNVPLASTPWAIAATTHVVAYAAPWADPLSSAEPDILTMYRLRLNIVTWVDINTPDDTVITNTAQVHGVVEGEPRSIGPLSDTVIAQGEADANLRIYPYDPATNTIDTVFAPGDPIDFGFSFNRANGMTLLRPILRVDFPPGVEIDTVSFHDDNNACPDLPGANGPPLIDGPLLDDGGTPSDPFDDHYYAVIDVLLGSPDPQLYTDGCSSYSNADWARRAFRATGTVIATYPHVSSVPLTVTALLEVANTSNVDAPGDGLPANQRRHSYNFNVITSAEMRVRVEASCSPDLGPAFVTYDYIMENTAGTHLTDMALVMTVPKVGVPAGNTVNTNFVSVTVPGAGEGVEYSVDGVNFSATPPANLADVTHVLFTKDQLDAYDTRTVTLVTSHTTSVALGTQFLTAATLDSAELSPVPNSTYTPWETGDCPAQLVVFKYFDETNLGAYDPPTDQPLSGWEFTTTGPTAETGTTGVDGEVVFLVLPGNYTVTETLPTPGVVTWSPTTAGGLTQTIAVGLEPSYTLEFGNACTCDDANVCTIDSCVYPGVCEGTPNTGELCDPGDLCNVCDETGACVPIPLDCSDPDTCQQPGQCDPATGQCVFLPIECEPLPIYVIVNGPDDQPAGTVRCTLEADQTVSCDMDGPYVAIDPTLWCPGE